MATTRLAFLNVQAAEDALPRIVELMGEKLKWSKAEKQVDTYSIFPRFTALCVHVDPVGVC